jgi:HEAT repeat protein
MRTLVLFALVLLGTLITPTSTRAFLEVSQIVPTLGRVVGQATRITVLRVDQVSRERQAILYKKVADLKGTEPDEIVKHKLTEGYHPREAHTILDQAEPGEIAVCFHAGTGSLTCVGRYWYLCTRGEAGWWTLVAGRPEMAYAYNGSASKLREQVTAILAGKEVVIPALKYRVYEAAPGKSFQRNIEHWDTYEALSAGRLMRGRQWPSWRMKVSLMMPPDLIALVQESFTGKMAHLVGDGAGTADDVPALVDALKHAEARVRLEAATDLGRIGPPASAALPPLRKHMENDADPLVCLAAAHAVASIDPKNEMAVALLVAGLKDRAAKVRRRSAEALGDLGTRSAVGPLIETAKDADPTVKWAVLDALGQIGPDAESALPILIEALKDTATRAAAIEALGQLGPKARSAGPSLEPMLQATEPALRWSAAASLVRIGGPEATAGVRFLLKPGIIPGRSKFDATQILTAPSARNALPALIEAVREPSLRDTATEVAGNIALHMKKELIPDGVRKLQSDKEPCVRSLAAWFLYAYGQGLDPKDTLPVLLEGLKAPDAWARRQAAHYLGTLGPNARDAVPALTALQRDEDETVREAATKALQSILRR